MQMKKSKLSLNITMDSSGGQDEEEVKNIPKPLQTTKAPKRIAFDGDTMDPGSRKSPDSNPSSFTFKDQSQLEYMMKRDPMEEFFSLTCQSIKLNSPHMNTICTIDTMTLYKKAVKLNVPFFKWSTWIEDFLNKEFLRSVLRKGRNSKQRQQMGQTFVDVEQKTKQKILDQAQLFQKELEDHQKEKNIPIAPRMTPVKKRGHGR